MRHIKTEVGNTTSSKLSHIEGADSGETGVLTGHQGGALYRTLVGIVINCPSSRLWIAPRHGIPSVKSPHGRQVDVQRPLVPQVVDSLLAHPVQAILGDLHVKIPQHAGQYCAHLDVCQTRIQSVPSFPNPKGPGMVCLLPPKTIPRSDMEWLECIPVVAGKGRIAEPALGMEGEGVFEMVVIVVHGPVVDGDDGLYGLRSALLLGFSCKMKVGRDAPFLEQSSHRR